MFYAGFILGWRRAINPDFQLPLRRDWLLTALLMCLPPLIWRHTLESAAGWDTLLLSNRGLGIIRVINSAALFYLIYALYRQKPDWFCGGVFG